MEEQARAAHGEALEPRSYVSFERSARGVITPKVKVYSNDADPKHLDIILAHAERIFGEALAFAIDYGEKP